MVPPEVKSLLCDIIQIKLHLEREKEVVNSSSTEEEPLYSAV